MVEKGYVVLHLETGCWDGIYHERVPAILVFERFRKKYRGRWVLLEVLDEYLDDAFEPDMFLADHRADLDKWNRRAKRARPDAKRGED